MKHFYILSLKHTHAPDKLATWWRPDDRGYCWHLPQAGRYTEEQVRENLGYYNNGCSTVAIPCEVVDDAAREFTIDDELHVYLGVRRHNATLKRLVNMAPFPFDRPQYREERWAKVIDGATRPTHGGSDAGE